MSNAGLTLDHNRENIDKSQRSVTYAQKIDYIISIYEERRDKNDIGIITLV